MTVFHGVNWSPRQSLNRASVRKLLGAYVEWQSTLLKLTKIKFVMQPFITILNIFCDLFLPRLSTLTPADYTFPLRCMYFPPSAKGSWRSCVLWSQ